MQFWKRASGPTVRAGLIIAASTEAESFPAGENKHRRGFSLMYVLVSKSSNQPNEIGFLLSWVSEAAPGFGFVVTVWRRTTVDTSY